MADMNRIIVEAEKAAAIVFDELHNTAYRKAQEAALAVFKKHGIEIEAKCVEFYNGRLTVRSVKKE